MRQRLLFILLLILILFLLGGILYTWGTPRLTGFEPAASAQSVPAAASIRLVFSRPMQIEMVYQSLDIQPQVDGSFSWEGSALVFTPARPWPSGQIITVSLKPGARAAGLLSFPLRDGQTWFFTIRTPRLVYLYPYDGPAQIYLLDFQSGETRQLTREGRVVDYSPAPDGLGIYFTTSRGAQGSSIQFVDLTAGQIRTILECPDALCHSARVSPDGAYLAYERSPLTETANTRVWLLQLNGTSAAGSPSQPAGNPAQITRQPLWSARSWLATYNLDRAAFIFWDPKTGASREVTSTSGVSGSWSPDGGSFIFSEVFAANISDPALLPDLSAIPSTHLMRFQVTDGALADLTASDDIEDTGAVFSPDGSLLAFSRRYLDQTRWTTGRQMWLMRPDGSASRPLSADPSYTHNNFSWDPASERIAYVRFDENDPVAPLEIWLINVDGSAAARLLTGGYAPQWVP